MPKNKPKLVQNRTKNLMQKKLILLRKKNSFGGILAPKNRIKFWAKNHHNWCPKTSQNWFKIVPKTWCRKSLFCCAKRTHLGAFWLQKTGSIFWQKNSPNWCPKTSQDVFQNLAKIWMQKKLILLRKKNSFGSIFAINFWAERHQTNYNLGTTGLTRSTRLSREYLCSRT